MSTSNPWLTPLQRSFSDIKAQVIKSLKEKVPEITDFSEGNIFVLILSIFAGIAEVIHYYIDGMAREAFLPTCRRYSSLYKHAKLVDYHIKSAIASTVDIVIYYSNPNSNTGYSEVYESIPPGAGDTRFPSNVTISENTVFTSTDGKQWVSTSTVVIPKGVYSYKVGLTQKQELVEKDLGTYSSENAIVYLGDIPSGLKYEEGSMVLTIDGVAWSLVTTFAYSWPEDKVFKVELDQSLKPYIVFGDGRFGRKPDIGSVLHCKYYLTYGAEGNIAANSFLTVPESLTNQLEGISITNPNPATGGSDYENFEMLKDHIPLSVKTLGVAITKSDYESITRLIPGVDKAYCNYICGRYVQVYITPDTDNLSVEASQALIAAVNAQLSAAKVLTTRIQVYSTHKAKIFLSATITGKKSFKAVDIGAQVKKALVQAYSPQTSDINKSVRQSDLYALIDGQSMVDYLQITEMYLLPFPIAVDPTTGEEVNGKIDLNITSFKMSSFQTGNPETDFENCYVTIVDGTNYRITPTLTSEDFTTGVFGQPLEMKLAKSVFTITIGLPLNGDISSYEPDTMYQLTIQPMGTEGRLVDLVPHNYNIPIFEEENINLTINEVV